MRHDIDIDDAGANTHDRRPPVDGLEALEQLLEADGADMLDPRRASLV